MKKLIYSVLIVAAAVTSVSAQPWANASLDINQAKAMVNSNGDLFWDYTNPGFEVPKGAGTHMISAGALWVGGLDAGGQLRLGAQTYRQSGNDFYPGPIMTQSSYSAANDVLWNRVWKINRSTVDSFRLGLFATIPAVIQDWPGNGNVAMGQAAQLAAYVDIDGDGVYNPSAGDYPCIKGDQAVFFMFNDGRNVHTETGGAIMNFEFHAMLYGYSAPGTWLDTVVFLNYKMYNRSSITLTNAYIGTFIDFDIGSYSDDFVGCDVGRSMFYGYNGDANDGTSAFPTTGTYGANPPAEGVVFLRGPLATPNDFVDNNRNGTVDEPGEVCLMNNFVYYNNDFTITGNPVLAQDYYGYMSGFWKDGTPITYGGNGYGGNQNADFMYPATSDATGWGTGGAILNGNWSEMTENNTPYDRRAFAGSGPFIMQPGNAMCLDFAFVYGRSFDTIVGSSIGSIQTVADSARYFYNQSSPCTCVINPLSVNEASHDLLVEFYPNPASDNVTVLYHPENGNATLEIYDMTGKIVATEIISKTSTVVDLKKLSPGIYLIRISDGKSWGTARVLKQ
ncbi:MAG: T9SS type A sorting domain-containing protein [Bacteroidota bacterium]|nr:T9SS type A sorting domain-containing protein [Bacteroidota bacterium]